MANTGQQQADIDTANNNIANDNTQIETIQADVKTQQDNIAIWQAQINEGNLMNSLYKVDVPTFNALLAEDPDNVLGLTITVTKPVVVAAAEEPPVQ